LLRLEIKKTQTLLTKLNEGHMRGDKRRRCDAKKQIFDHGINGVKQVMNKLNTTMNLQEVDQACPTGLSWARRPITQGETTGIDGITEWLAPVGKDKYDIEISASLVTITAKILTNVPNLLSWSSTHHNILLLPPTLLYSTGPWTKANLMTAV